MKVARTPTAEAPNLAVEQSVGSSYFECKVCGRPSKTAQGLAGHARLAHSSSTARTLEERRRELEERSQSIAAREAELSRASGAANRREGEIARRQQEIDETGPESIGLEQCEDCDAWFEDSEALSSHSKAVHPIDGTVATELGVSRSRVNDVWTEACRKSERHPKETPEEIISRFWDGKDREILQKLRERNAAFRFSKEGD
jgi:hypothetical protein